MDKDEAGKRIKAIALALDLKVNDFAAQTGINITQMYSYSAGQNLPNWPTLDRILTTFPNVSAEYLMRGEGAVLNNLNK